MQKFFILALLLCGLIVPALAADTPEGTAKRVVNLEKATLVMQEDLANTKLALEETQDNNAKSFKELTARLDQLQKSLNAEIAARGESDKLIAELQTELVNQRMKTAQLQEALNKEKADRETAVAQLDTAIKANTVKDKKDRTITYAVGALLGILAIAK